jgi:hypothetical protein
LADNMSISTFYHPIKVDLKFHFVPF